MILFRTAEVKVEDGVIAAKFHDGKTNEFHLKAMAGDEEYRRIAQWAGYGDDWERYGLEHELLHHALADKLGWRWSWSLHDNLPQPWPDHIAWEEHQVNRIQRLMMTGEPDEYGVLQGIYGSNLDDTIDRLRQMLRRLT